MRIESLGVWSGMEAALAPDPAILGGCVSSMCGWARRGSKFNGAQVLGSSREPLPLIQATGTLEKSLLPTSTTTNGIAFPSFDYWGCAGRFSMATIGFSYNYFTVESVACSYTFLKNEAGEAELQAGPGSCHGASFSTYDWIVETVEYRVQAADGPLKSAPLTYYYKYDPTNFWNRPRSASLRALS